MTNLPDPVVACASIAKSVDKAWLLGFRERMMAAGAPDIVTAINARLGQLGEDGLRAAIGMPRSNLSVEERVEEALRVYELLLAHKHAGKRLKAGYSRRLIKRVGPEKAVAEVVLKSGTSSGFDLLQKFGRLDCSYEQIVLDFPHEFTPDVVLKAQRNLLACQERL